MCSYQCVYALQRFDHTEASVLNFDALLQETEVTWITTTQLRILNVLKKWIHTFPTDFTEVRYLSVCLVGWLVDPYFALTQSCLYVYVTGKDPLACIAPILLGLHAT